MREGPKGEDGGTGDERVGFRAAGLEAAAACPFFMEAIACLATN
jgi:hypothetical protein